MSINAKPRDYTEELANIDKKINQLRKDIVQHENKIN